jgi:guanyl-specific ribonuclease Sa
MGMESYGYPPSPTDPWGHNSSDSGGMSWQPSDFPASPAGGASDVRTTGGSTNSMVGDTLSGVAEFTIGLANGIFFPEDFLLQHQPQSLYKTVGHCIGAPIGLLAYFCPIAKAGAVCFTAAKGSYMIAREGFSLLKGGWNVSKLGAEGKAAFAAAKESRIGINAIKNSQSGKICKGLTSSGKRETTEFLSEATIKSHGKIVGQGTVDLRETLRGIKSGELAPRDIFQNREGLLPRSTSGYYKEFVHPSPGVEGVGPQRVILGEGGELFYSPDHYESFVPLN